MPHPASPLNKLSSCEIFVSLPESFRLANSFESDSKKPTISIDINPVVALQRLQCGVIPIHFSSRTNGVKDPINITDLKHHRVNNIMSITKMLVFFRKNLFLENLIECKTQESSGYVFTADEKEINV